MQLNNYIQAKFPFFVALSLTILLASCGSYQYVGYDNDGIYSNNEEIVYEEARTVPIEDQSVYKDYFTEKSLQYSDIPDDGSAIFTDIDAYEGNYNNEPLEDEVQTGYAGWGQESSDVTINVYNSGWNSQYWGNGYGYGWYRPWRYNNWAWSNPYGYNYGWNNWGWNSGFAFGWNAGYGYGYGYGWNNNFWYPPYYRNNYHRGNSYAYNTGRRGANASSLNRNSNYSRRSSSTSLSRRSSSTIRNRATTRNRATARNRASNSSVSPRRATTTRRTNSTTTRPRTTTRSRSNNSSVRSNNNTRSSAPRASSSRSNSRSSSSSVRSSRSSSRSSGSSRGSSGRRGN
ncbi:hypothetical protein [Psychroserpens damuponensis]|uniref:hypothetical protein n=1 Tax=Psychroserpens damuponensis TaxID=943936 RepID=UPI00058E0D19|nr:hypothetical protein [Psychroserpens damuponensis]